MFKKYLFLSFLVFTNLYSMEDFKNCNPKKNISIFEFEDLKIDDYDNKNKKLFLDLLIKKLPKEIWFEILGYIDYKDNRRMFVNFLAPLIGIDDLNSKKIVIDIYRSVILNSKNLDQWKSLTNNVCKSWKHKESKRSVKKYLNILNGNFSADIKKYSDLDLLNNKSIDLEICSIIEKYNSIGLSYYHYHSIYYSGNGGVVAKKKEYFKALYDLKKMLLIIDKSNDSVFVRFNLYSEKIFLVCIIPLILLVIKFILYFNIPASSEASFFLCSVSFMVFIVFLLKVCEKNDRIINVKAAFESIWRELKTNNIDIFESDNYFFKILSHKIAKNKDILKLEDVDALSI